MVHSLPEVQTKSAQFSAPFVSENCILAAIDIGTNSIHMVVVQINTQLRTFTIIAREKDTVRLGNRDPKTGKLTPEAMQRALESLQRCQDLATSLKAEHIIAVATSAMREAANGHKFLQTIQSKLGLAVNLISGYEEARRIYLGVLSGMEFHNQPHVIIDIGGGSTELILADSNEHRFLSSTKVGAVRLNQEFITGDPISDNELNYLQAYVHGMLERAVEELKSNLRPGEKPSLVGTSGTIKALALIHAAQHLGTEPNPLNGYTFSRHDLNDMIQNMASMTCSQRYELPGMSDKRAEIIVPGAIVLQEAMVMLDLHEITICERALREGVIVDWMLSHGLIEDKLRYQGSVRERSVYKIAQKYRVDLPYSERIANFAISIFDQTKGKLHHWNQRERELLWAATILHNCGVYISHSSHHKHSYYLIRHAELLGFTEMEVELIANLARYHRKSKPKKKHDNYSHLSDQSRQMVSQVSAILRLAVALDRRQLGAINQVICQYNRAQKTLHLQIVPHRPDDDCALEMWNLELKKVVFEEEYGVKVLSKVDLLLIT